MSIATRMRPAPAVEEVPPNTNGKMAAAPKREQIKITPPDMKTIALRIKGEAPYLQCRFPQKAMNQIMAKQQAGDKARAGKRPVRPPRDYDADFEGSLHRLDDKTFGIPASAFRSAAISACRLVGFKMTMAKLSIFFEADGFDVIDQTPLVRIIGRPEKHVMMGRNADGSPDVRVRGIYREWSAVLRVRFDQDQFQTADVVNLVMRIGQQVGVGEGRPDSKNSAGLGFGLFNVQVD
jgi:hypothetical protein